MPHLEPEDAKVVIVVRNYYCVHFADVMSKGANEAELAEFDGNPPSHPSSFAKNPKEASGVALIRKACKAFAAGGCEKYGCYGKAKLFLEPILKEKFDTNTIPITPFRGHRFNIMPHNAVYVHCLHPYLVEFLSLNHENGLTDSLLGDLKQPFFMAEVKTFAIFCLLYTMPLWRMIEDRQVDIVKLGKAYVDMVAGLEDASKKPEVLLEGKGGERESERERERERESQFSTS